MENENENMISCPHCGKSTDAKGKYCQWCGETVHDAPEKDTVTLKSPTKDSGSRWAIIGLVLVLFALLFIVFIAISLQETTTTTITITEKYPAHSYTGWCGKFQCQQVDPPSVVDEHGVVYAVANMQLWGMLRVNNTYEVRYFHNPLIDKADQKTIDGAIVDGVAYTAV